MGAGQDRAAFLLRPVHERLLDTLKRSGKLLVLERRDPARDMARFYVLSLEETLFGDTALVREWGRLGTTGRRRLDLFERRLAAREALDAWPQRKLRRGYYESSTAVADRG